MVALPAIRRTFVPFLLALILAAAAACPGGQDSELAESVDPVMLGSSVAFTVRDAENGRTIAGADVTLAPTSGSAPLTAQSNAGGEATFSGAPQGPAFITVTAQGYRTESDAIVVSPSSASPQRFEALMTPSL